MISNKKPISMVEATEYIEKEEGAETIAFVKKFVSISPDDARQLREKLEGLDIIKMNQSHIAKIIDLLPEDSESLNKIFSDIGLDENETKKIIDTIKEFK